MKQIQDETDSRIECCLYNEFFSHIRAGEKGWFQLLGKLLNGNRVARPFASQAKGAVAEALVVAPDLVFQFWQEHRNWFLQPSCTNDLVDEDTIYVLTEVVGLDRKEAFWDALDEPSYISVPSVRKELIKRKSSVLKSQKKEFSSVKQKCLSHLNSVLNFHGFEEKLGFSFNKDGRYERKAARGTAWYFKGLKEPASWHEELEKNISISYASVTDRYSSVLGALRDAGKWPFIIGRIEFADTDWLKFIRETYRRYPIFYDSYDINIDLALGQAIEKDPKVVFSILNEVLSKGDNLKNVCGNTYEDLLWGVAVEEQVIGAALEKLEARKKSLTSMKDKSLSNMKNQCIQAVDNSLVVWKGRAQ